MAPHMITIITIMTTAQAPPIIGSIPSFFSAMFGSHACRAPTCCRRRDRAAKGVPTSMAIWGESERDRGEEHEGA